MKNMMKEYLGNDYTENHLKNFCLYWMKAAKGYGDEWRAKNDLDCLYFDGNLRADTLMSAWTPIKWVADFVNSESGIKFYKRNGSSDPDHYLRLLADETDKYLPPEHNLVKLLNRFLVLAELRCNFILLPDRKMNCARYNIEINGREVGLFDEVPATLSHIFDRDSLGRYFLGESGDVNEEFVIRWIKREHLEMGFEDGEIDKSHVRSLIPGLDPHEAKWLKDEEEIQSALEYMIGFLEKRLDVFANEPDTDKEKMDVNLDGDLSEAEYVRISDILKKLCGWDSGDHLLPYENRYKEAREAAETSQIRPEWLSCDRLWEIVTFLDNLKGPVTCWGKFCTGSKQDLYKVEDFSFGHGETSYGRDSSGWELPWSRYEWADVSLKNLRTGCVDVCRIELNSLEVQRFSVETILEWGGIGLPDYEEIKEKLDLLYGV